MLDALSRTRGLISDYSYDSDTFRSTLHARRIKPASRTTLFCLNQ